MDVWADGEKYDAYMGRWSRLVARELVEWLAIRRDAAWLDVGCGTGALSSTILERAAPRLVCGIDASEGYVAAACARLAGQPFTAQVADATALPFPEASFDTVASATRETRDHEPRCGSSGRATIAPMGSSAPWVVRTARAAP